MGTGNLGVRASALAPSLEFQKDCESPWFNCNRTAIPASRRASGIPFTAGTGDRNQIPTFTPEDLWEVFRQNKRREARRIPRLGSGKRTSFQTNPRVKPLSETLLAKRKGRGVPPGMTWLTRRCIGWMVLVTAPLYLGCLEVPGPIDLDVVGHR